MICMLASRTCTRGSDALRYGTRSPRSSPPCTPPGDAAIDRAGLGYLLGGRLGVWLGDGLNGSVVFFIGI